jgi:hypothetical protein
MIPVLRRHFALTTSIAEEVDVRHGRVDLCAYTVLMHRAPISAPALRLYAKIGPKFVSLDDLTLDLLASTRVLQAYARELERHDLIDRRRGEVRRRRAYRYPIQKILAVEAKLADWRKACEQVLLHRNFADELWVALDLRSIARVDYRYVKQHKIGVLATEPDGVFVAHPATKIPSSRSFSLDRAIVSESILARHTKGDHEVSCMRAATFVSRSAFDVRSAQALASQALT